MKTPAALRACLKNRQSYAGAGRDALRRVRADDPQVVPTHETSLNAIFRQALKIFCLFFFVTATSWGALPELLPVSDAIPADVKVGLNTRHAALERQLAALLKLSADFTRDCTGRDLKKDSPEMADCLAQQKKVQSTKTAYLAAANEYNKDAVINGMNAHAKSYLKWSAEKQARLDQALKKLHFDGDANATSDQIRLAWKDALARRGDGDLSREASHGDGPALSGAGTQTTHEDCAIFALANATSQPYGVVAARATGLIRTGGWRAAAGLADPQKIIEEQGLMGGEVIMLAESFGQAEVIPSSNFPKTLKEGRPVMINVVPANGDFHAAHEVVLTKTFRHGGETWFEMMDSNQGPDRRLYLSGKELNILLQENGVAFRPEPGTTVPLLRKE